MNAEVFISYASEDRARILDLVERLRSAGVSVWIDQMGIEGATMWSQPALTKERSACDGGVKKACEKMPEEDTCGWPMVGALHNKLAAREAAQILR